jgi:hypothetical protein
VPKSHTCYCAILKFLFRFSSRCFILHFYRCFFDGQLTFFCKKSHTCQKNVQNNFVFFSNFSNFQLLLFFLHFFKKIFVTNNGLNKKISNSSFFFSHSKKDIIEFLFFGHLFLSIFQKSRGLLRFF